MIACRDGERCESRVNDRSKSFVPLMDRIAMRAAREGSLAGFDGRVIYVRSAGEEAWLGKEAPENAGFDVIDDDPFSDDTIDTSKHPDFAPGREVSAGRVRNLRGRGQDIDPAGRSQRPRRGVRDSKTSFDSRRRRFSRSRHRREE